GNFQASYWDTIACERVTAERTFLTDADADAWLSLRHAELITGRKVEPAAPEPAQRGLTLGEYAPLWLEERRTPRRHTPLSARTKQLYRSKLTNFILPAFGETELTAITRAMVDAWYKRLDPTTPTARAHAWSLLATMMQSAMDEDRI